MLYSLAFYNTRRKFSAITLPISKIFCWGYSCSTEDELWIMSNEYLWYVGTALLYEDLLHNLAGQLQDNLYILPSSVNEILVLAAKNNKDSKLFREIVSDVMIVL